MFKCKVTFDTDTDRYEVEIEADNSASVDDILSVALLMENISLADVRYWSIEWCYVQ